MIYKWNSGFPSHGANINAVVKEINELKRKEKITPQQIVLAARDKKSAMHSIFVWDNTIAAGRYREEQARAMLRAIITIKNEKSKNQIRAFVSIREESGDESSNRSYVSMSSAMSKAQWREQILSDARRELEGWVRRYEAYKELAKEVKSVRSIVERIPIADAS